METRSRRPQVRTAWILILVWICGVSGLADSELIFPRISFGDNQITGVAVVNPREDESAVVTLTAYGPDGEILSADGFQNPAEVTVAPGRQFADVTSSIFGPGFSADQVGWIYAVSQTNDLSGFFLYLTVDPSTGSVEVFDGADLPEVSQTLIFNEIQLDGGFATELNLLNPGSATVEVQLSLSGLGEPIQRTIELPAKGAARVDAGEFFGLDPRGPQGSDDAGLVVTAAAATGIAGFAFVQGEGDLLGLNARPADERLEQILFPQLAVLGGVNSEVVVVNYGEETVLVTLRAHRPDGSLYGTEDLRENPVTVSLGAGEALRRDLAELFGFTGDRSLEGWLEVVSTSPAVNGSLSYSIPAVHSLASVAGLRGPVRRALFSHIATTLGFFTGVAVLNGSELTANVRVVALRSDGSTLGSFSTVLLPGERISRLISDLIPEAADQAGGFIWISSDTPVFLTSLFGSSSSGVLANIPPQPVPDFFEPDSDQPRPALEPILAILEPAASQQFSLTGTNAAPVWSVNNLQGGSNQLGNVTAAGLYTAPAAVPEDLPVTISAAAENSVVGGSIDILSPELFLESGGVIQSVAYLSSTGRVYFSELGAAGGTVAEISADAGLGSFSAGRPSGAAVTRILEVVASVPRPLVELPGEEVPDIVPFRGSDGTDYLLLAARTSGRILRLDPSTGAPTEVATGLDEPSALVFDAIDGELLVAQGSGVTAIPAGQLNVGLSTADAAVPLGESARRDDFLDAPPGRLTVNQCNGNVYLSLEEEGQILEYVRATGALRVLADGLARPGPMLGLYRRGVGCPDAFHMLVPERGAGRILLFLPALNLVRPWLEISEVTGLTLIPPGVGEIAPSGGFLIAGARDGGSRILLVRFRGIYLPMGFNPPDRSARSGCVLTQVTRTEGAEIRVPRTSADGRRLVFVSSGDLTGGNPDGSDEIFLVEAEGEPVQLTDLTAGAIQDVALNSDGTRILFVTDARLTDPEPAGENLVLLDTTDGSLIPIPLQPEGPVSIDGAGLLVVAASRGNPVAANPDRNREIFLFQDGGPGNRTLRQLTETRNAGSLSPAISAGGTTVAFRSTADLAGENPNADGAVFVYELTSDRITQVAIDEASPEQPLNRPILISGDGRRLVFTSDQNLNGENPSGERAVFLADTDTGELRKLLGSSRRLFLADLSPDGRFVGLSTTANPLRLNPDRNVEVFLAELESGRLFQLTRSRDAVNRQADLAATGRLSVTFLSNFDYVGRNPDREDEVYRLRCVK